MSSHRPNVHTRAHVLVAANLRPQKRRHALSPLRGLAQFSLAGLICAGAWTGFAASATQTDIETPPKIQQSPAGLAPGLIDVDGDGVADFATPAENGIRGADHYGSGSFGAERDGGHRVHEGVDFIAAPGADIRAPLSGTITKTGYAYRHDSRLRFVEVTDETMHMTARIFYVSSALEPGAAIKAGDILGEAQDLSVRYRLGITNHVHLEITDEHGRHYDPAKLLESPAGALLAMQEDQAFNATARHAHA